MHADPRKLAGALAVLVALALGVAALAQARTTGAAAQAIKLADATMIVEVNATDGDAGLQVFLDGEPWRSMKVSGPDGRTILDVASVGRLKNYGLTELFSESSEPSFDEFPLEEFKALFPAGRYTFAGTTIEGRPLTGSARLSHAIPEGPKIVSPRADSVLSRRAVVARWRAVANTSDIRIAGYRAIVTREQGTLRVLSADLPASARSLRVPAEFFQAGVEYKLEVQAIERSGNQTLTEVSFRVR